MFKYAIATLGCKVNQCDAAEMSGEFTALGGVSVPFEGRADIYVINTCSVTGRSDCQSRQLINRATRLNPGALIAVTGCYATRAAAEITGLPGASLVLGNSQKRELPSLAVERLFGPQRFAERPLSNESPTTDLVENLPNHTRAFLKIQDGCNAACAYCVVPATRGISRSVAFEHVKSRLTLLGEIGYKEAVLTGIHLGIYGQDLSPPHNLGELLSWANETRPLARLRLSSLEPNEIGEDIVSSMINSGVVCPHLHIPLQSGDDRILAAMGRPYRRDRFRELVLDLLDALPDIALGLDVMAGFPGENDEAFARTMELIENLPVAYLHVFPYSRRPGTRAAAIAPQVDTQTKKKRAATLRNLGELKKRDYARKFIGRPLSVLVQTMTDNDRTASGIAENYLTVAISQPNGIKINDLVKVVPDRYENGRLYGQPL